MLPALRRRLVGSEGALFYVMICGLLLVIPGLVIPTFTRIFIDDYLVGNQEWMVRPLLWLHGGDHRHPGGADVAAAATTCCASRPSSRSARRAASSTTSCGCRRPTSASASPARSARASPINDDVAKIYRRPARDHRHRQRPDDLLRDADVPLRRQADAGGASAVGLLNVAAVKAASRRPHRRQPAPDAGSSASCMGTAMNGLQMIETLKATGSEGEFFGALGRLLRQVDQHRRSTSACSARSAARCRRSCRPRRRRPCWSSAASRSCTASSPSACWSPTRRCSAASCARSPAS